MGALGQDFYRKEEVMATKTSPVDRKRKQKQRQSSAIRKNRKKQLAVVKPNGPTNFQHH